MISERRLASDYSSFWRTMLPLSDSFTRRINAQLQKFASPLKSNFNSERGGLVSELGFRYFGAVLGGALTQSVESYEPSDTRKAIEHETTAYIARLHGNTGTADYPSLGERHQAKLLAERLQHFVAAYEGKSDLELEPEFRGCGIVDSCRGDFRSGATLYEVKNVGRDFRAVDWRQLLIYCTLASISPHQSIQSIGLVNARHGTFARLSIDQVAIGMAGVSSADLFAQIVQFICAEHASQ